MSISHKLSCCATCYHYNAATIPYHVPILYSPNIHKDGLGLNHCVYALLSPAHPHLTTQLYIIKLTLRVSLLKMVPASTVASY